MTIPHDTTAKLIGLAATGAAMLGFSLEEALLTDPAELTAYIRTLTGAGLLPTANRQPAEESPAVLSPANFPSFKALPLPQPPSLTARGEILEAPEGIDWDDPALYV